MQKCVLGFLKHLLPQAATASGVISRWLARRLGTCGCPGLLSTFSVQAVGGGSARAELMTLSQAAQPVSAPLGPALAWG